MEAKLHRSFAYPFFLLSMVLLSGVFTLGINFKENNLTYVFLAIVLSVIIYFFNDLSAVLGKTEKLPVEISVWMPIVIIFIFSAIKISPSGIYIYIIHQWVHLIHELQRHFSRTTTTAAHHHSL